MSFRSDVNSISSSLGRWDSSSFFEKPAFAAATTRAPSVGSPIIEEFERWESLLSAPMERTISRSSMLAGFPLWRIARSRDLDLLSLRVDAPYRHLVFGKRPCLIRADDCGGSQGLDRRKPSNQSVAFYHAL